MITTYPLRPASRLVKPVRQGSGKRRVMSEDQWLAGPWPALGGALLLLLLLGCGWLGWQVQQHNGAFSQERMVQDNLERTNRDLSAQRARMLSRDNIVSRAAALGLHPARPDQIRKVQGPAAG